MEHAFWFARWEKDEIGFHQPDGNPLLPRHWERLGLTSDARVLVPLCGKTPDLAWLARQGHTVVGVELSEKAATDFFDENGVAPEQRRCDGFTVLSGAGVDIWVGDFFAMPDAVLAECNGLYDRASLIALPPAMRHSFADQLNRAMPSDARGLLISIDYPEDDMDGPPFSVTEEEIARRFEPDWHLITLERNDALAANPFLQDRGLTALHESAYFLRKR